MTEQLVYNDLTDEQREDLKQIHFDKTISWDVKEKRLSEYANRSARTVRSWMAKMGVTKPTEIKSPQLEKSKTKTHAKKKYYLITWAQNNTPVLKGLLKNMESYADFIGAEILVIAGRYKNPTSVFPDNKAETWANSLLPYLDSNRHDIHKHMSVMSDVKIQPTAKTPLTSLHALSKGNSCVFGHPKMHMATLPVLDGTRPKNMFTTGCITVQNYTDSLVGKTGEFYHTYGFVIVEIKDDEVFYARQVAANNKGDFNDLYWNVSKQKITRNYTIDSAVLGDIHHANHNFRVMDTTMNELLSKLKPKNLILHDIFDAESINHHEAKDPFVQFEHEIKGKNNLKQEVDNMVNWVNDLLKYDFKKIVVVRSNHDNFIDRWLVDTDWRKANTPKNSLTYMKYASLILSGEASDGIIPWVLSELSNRVVCLGVNESFKSLGWEFGQHGDIGANGSRGSFPQYRKLNTKIVVGHSHTPLRMDGALSVGTSTWLKLNYNKGASSWMNSHVIIHNDGKAQHINFYTDTEGEFNFTTFK